MESGPNKTGQAPPTLNRQRGVEIRGDVLALLPLSSCPDQQRLGGDRLARFDKCGKKLWRDLEGSSCLRRLARLPQLRSAMPMQVGPRQGFEIWLEVRRTGSEKELRTAFPTSE